MGGFVAGEGCFTTTSGGADRVDGSARVRFVFSVAVAERDRLLLDALQTFLGGRGSIRRQVRGNERWLPAACYSIGGRKSIREVVLPFCDLFLLASAKREQFERWRAEFDAYERSHPTRWGRGSSRCSVEGCEKPVRGQGLGAADRQSCALLRTTLGVGNVFAYERRRDHFDDEIRFQVRKLSDLVEVIVPFMDEHLPPSHKREQYLAWRAQLLDYWEHRARRRRPCTIPGCDAPQRAKGVCRRHYYERFGS